MLYIKTTVGKKKKRGGGEEVNFRATEDSFLV